MSTKKIISVVVLSVIAVMLCLGVVMNWYYNNKANKLETRAEKQEGKIEVVYDEMWKVLNQDAQVANEYKEAFAEIYPKLIEGRYSNGGGELMMWIKEQNPSFDVSLYKELMKKIEIQRNKFSIEQIIMLDIVREHKNLLINVPSKWFLGDRVEIEYIVISSTITKQVMETRLDDNVELFKKDSIK